MTFERRLAPGKYRLQVSDYRHLAEAGAFRGLRTELIEGDVFVMSPQFRPHGMAKMELYDALRDGLRQIGSALRPVIEFSLALSADSMPDPDIMLTSEPAGQDAVPLPSVALVIEVSDSSLLGDLDARMRLYATAGVPEYWVADVNGRVIHQMWAPADDGYAERREVPFGEAVTAATIPHLTITTPR